MIADDIAAALPELQAHAESMMTSTCVVRRPDGGSAVDPATLVATPTYLPDAIHVGRCKVQTRVLVISAEDTAESKITVQRLELHVPVTAGPFEPYDVAEITSSRQPHLVGARYQIQEDDVKEWQTAKRLSVLMVGSQ